MKALPAFFILLICLIFAGCNSSDQLHKGIWRAVLETSNGTEIPFNFELSGPDDSPTIHIINGKDRFKVENITRTADSLFVKLPLFDSEIRAKFSSDGLQGKWIKYLPNKHPAMKFSAEPGVEWRFFEEENLTPEVDIQGRWSTIFKDPAGSDSTLAVGEFTYEGKKLTGTFLTSTGDYRFLEGTIRDNKVYLSTFDGSNAYLFTGTIKNDRIVDGKFHSGLTSIENWQAEKDQNASLPDAYSLTKLKPGENRISFTFPDLEGNKVSLSDPRFRNKVVIIQFLGSWCPNCMDETAFLAPFYREYKTKGVEIVGLAYERSSDFQTAKTRVQQLKQRFNIGYPLLVTGFTNKEVLKSMPSLNEFKAFPTTIIIDKKGLVRTIHTGFSGPGTGKHYTDLTAEFEKRIQLLLKEG
ncbi:TlpA disulfide reductase family protein [Paradesertivirga mongoliensis]|uniref:TlpA disulfide reductase family protein n=1 Tax=Paradesertivirga mongoliensis TaxID=2100740 RepID=A0ABW4ZHW1_9SPHI|nr:TlpA disulfide reductase family protein [Pedobacter mongoliensis]